MRGRVLGVVAIAFLAGTARAGAPVRLTWGHEGLAALVRAAEDAKQGTHRLLLGLSGSET